MKKLLSLITVCCLLLGLAGCGATQPKQQSASPPSQDVATRDTPMAREPVMTNVPMYAISLPTVKETVSSDAGTLLFSLTFQQTQVFLHSSELEENITGDLQTRMGSVLATAYEIEAQAQQDYPNSEYWSEYFIDISYTPTRFDQSVLSLFGNSFSYSGGAHPSLVTDSVNYDLETGEALFLEDILTPECTADILYDLILQSLAQQESDLYYDYADALADRFTNDLESIQDWYFSRNGLCFHFAPYDIAPYSSGTIIATLPFSSLDGILKSKYIPTEPSTATGSMYAETYIEDDSERFEFIAEVALGESDTDVLLYPDATVTDLRIESGFRDADNNQFVSGATVFAASTMNVGDAIRLTTDLTDSGNVLRLIYHSDNQEYSSFITYDAAGDSILLTNA